MFLIELFFCILFFDIGDFFMLGCMLDGLVVGGGFVGLMVVWVFMWVGWWVCVLEVVFEVGGWVCLCELEGFIFDVGF